MIQKTTLTNVFGNTFEVLGTPPTELRDTAMPKTKDLPLSIWRVQIQREGQGANRETRPIEAGIAFSRTQGGAIALARKELGNVPFTVHLMSNAPTRSTRGCTIFPHIKDLVR